ncbi:LuxR C-terminal-related transcriptional regulator [Microbacterium sp. NPDC076911]|uniref:helix-turn-helix transcriptional regulator n=1 Tax=Microbacterium sp. NPDC076911 TaxID=3154958 RepID=UPI003435EC6C
MVDASYVGAVRSADHIGDDLLQRVAASFPPHSFLVIDAYENVGTNADRLADELMTLDAMADDLHLIVTTHSAGNFASASRVLRDEVRVVTADDLAFNLEETELLLERIDRAEDAKALHAATKGYPLALRSALLSSSNPKVVPQFVQGGDATVWAPLVADHLRNQIRDPRLLEFARLTSLCAFFDRDLAASITGWSDLDPVIETFQRAGLGRWIPFGYDLEVFQYIDSFRETMREDARRGAIHGAALAHANHVSARWFEKHGLVEDALALAISANSLDMATALTMNLLLTVPETYTSGRLRPHLSMVSKTALAVHPILAFALGLGMLVDPHARAGSVELFNIVNENLIVDALTPQGRFFEYGVLTVSQRLAGRFDQAAESAERVWTTYRELSDSERNSLGSLATVALRNASYAFLQAGLVDTASEVLRAALLGSEPGSEQNFTLAFASGVNAIEGRSDLAVYALDRQDPQSWPRRLNRSYMSLLGEVGAAQVRLDALDAEGVAALITEDAAYVRDSEFWPFAVAMSMRADLARGNAELRALLMAKKLTEAPKPPGIGNNFGTALVYNELALLWLACRRFNLAREALAAFGAPHAQLSSALILFPLVQGDFNEAIRQSKISLDRHGHTRRSRASVALLSAAAAAQRGSAEFAITRLRSAVVDFQMYGIRSDVLLLPLPAREALCRLADAHGLDVREYIPESLHVPFLMVESPVPRLSASERRVLQALMASRSDTTATLAASLFVSVNTLKSQLSAIYRKLGVSSREQAVERAHSLGL